MSATTLFVMNQTQITTTNKKIVSILLVKKRKNAKQVKKNIANNVAGAFTWTQASHVPQVHLIVC